MPSGTLKVAFVFVFFTLNSQARLGYIGYWWPRRVRYGKSYTLFRGGGGWGLLLTETLLEITRFDGLKKKN